MKNIVISRLDNIGDVILTLPLISHIKSIYPNAEISYIAKRYSLPVLSECDLISSVVEWESLEEMEEKQLTKAIAALDADIFIHSTPKRKLAKAVYQARVPIRIGSARRIFHWLYCNRRPWIPDHRHCLTHMSDHFLALAKPLARDPLPSAASISVSNTLHFSTPLPETVSSLLAKDRFNLILHPGSNNHAPEWPTAHLLSLATLLPATQFNILITGTADEERRFQDSLLSQLPEHVHNLMGSLDLPQFLSLIAQADGVTASSTGPIHVSGVLNKRTVGLYPPRTPNSFDWELTAHKWKPLGSQVTTLSSTSSCSESCTTETFSGCHCMSAITPETVASTIQSWI
ncbi:MAG: glycosyltransferase family 9 protein [Gammaproteobacteria bacterium]|nr:glycosyltransferase family 9 protein [Gammaproteobacteria bacterium]